MAFSDGFTDPNTIPVPDGGGSSPSPDPAPTDPGSFGAAFDPGAVSSPPVDNSFSPPAADPFSFQGPSTVWHPSDAAPPVAFDPGATSSVVPPIQQQDAPPSSAQLGITAQQAAAQLAAFNAAQPSMNSGGFDVPPAQQNPRNPMSPALPRGFNPYAVPDQPAPTGVIGGINDFAQQSIRQAAAAGYGALNTAFDYGFNKPLGAVALATDQDFTNGALARAVSRQVSSEGLDPNSVQGKLRALSLAHEDVMNSLGKIGENPNANILDRALAQTTRGTDLFGSLVTPVLPGAELLKNLPEGAQALRGVLGDTQRLISDAARPNIVAHALDEGARPGADLAAALGQTGSAEEKIAARDAQLAADRARNEAYFREIAPQQAAAAPLYNSNLERMLAQGGDQSRLPAETRAADQAAAAAGERSPSGDVALQQQPLFQNIDTGKPGNIDAAGRPQFDASNAGKGPQFAVPASPSQAVRQFLFGEGGSGRLDLGAGNLFDDTRGADNAKLVGELRAKGVSDQDISRYLGIRQSDLHSFDMSNGAGETAPLASSKPGLGKVLPDAERAQQGRLLDNIEQPTTAGNVAPAPRGGEILPNAERRAQQTLGLEGTEMGQPPRGDPPGPVPSSQFANGPLSDLERKVQPPLGIDGVAHPQPGMGSRIFNTAEQMARALKTAEIFGSPMHFVTRHASPFITSHPAALAQGIGEAAKTLVRDGASTADRLQSLRLQAAKEGFNPDALSSLHTAASSGEELGGPALIKRLGPLGEALTRTGDSFTIGIDRMRLEAMRGATGVSIPGVRPATAADKAAISDTVRIFSGKGFQLGQDAAGWQKTLARVAAVPLFTPQFLLARVRMLGETALGLGEVSKGIAQYGLSKAGIGEAQAISPQAIERVRLGVGHLGSLAAWYGVLNAAGFKVDTNVDSSNFLRTDLGPRSGVTGAIAGVAGQIGMGTVDEKGHVFLDLGGPEAPLIRAALHTWRNFATGAQNIDGSPKGIQPVTDFLTNQFGPGFYQTAQLLKGRHVDFLSALAPMWASSGARGAGWQPPTVKLGSARDFKSDPPADIILGPSPSRRLPSTGGNLTPGYGGATPLTPGYYGGKTPLTPP